MREEREATEKADAPDGDREDSESWAKCPDHSRTCHSRCLQARVRGDGFPEPFLLPCRGAEAPHVFCGLLLSLSLVPVSGRVQSRETGAQGNPTSTPPQCRRPERASPSPAAFGKTQLPECPLLVGWVTSAREPLGACSFRGCRLGPSPNTQTPSPPLPRVAPRGGRFKQKPSSLDWSSFDFGSVYPFASESSKQNRTTTTKSSNHF